MITRVKVKNFRNLADVDVELGPMTVLVGRNGAGKSTFLDVLRFVRDALASGLDAAIDQRSGIQAVRRWSPQGRPYNIEILLDFRDATSWGTYSFIIESSQMGSYTVKQEQCAIHREGRSSARYEIKGGKWIKPPTDWFINEETASHIKVDTTMLMLPTVSRFFSLDYEGVERHLTRTGFYALFPNTLREPQKPSNEDTLSDHGDNLAAVLRQLKRKGDSFPDLIAVLGRVSGNITDVRVKQAGGYFVTELKHEIKNGRSAWFPLAQVSDGTLRALGLLTALYQNAPQTLIAIEEPELTLHPGVFGLLSDVLYEASTRNQVLITTQSPDLISRFSADELRVVERIEGLSSIGPVDERQRAAINQQLFTAGDLLRIEGLHITSRAEAA